MGYTKQNFKSGDVLTASQLNAMDEQIARNEAYVLDFTIEDIENIYRGNTSGSSINISLPDLLSAIHEGRGIKIPMGYSKSGTVDASGITEEDGTFIQLMTNNIYDSAYTVSIYTSEEGAIRSVDVGASVNFFESLEFGPYIDDNLGVTGTIRSGSGIETTAIGVRDFENATTDYGESGQVLMADGEGGVKWGNVSGSEVIEVKQYAELEFLEGTEGQQIQTDFLVEENDVIEMDYMIPAHNLDIAGDKVYLTTKTIETNTNRIRFSTYGNNKKFYVRFGDNAAHTTGAVLDASKMSGTIVIKKGAFIVNGETIAELAFKAMPATPLVLFSTDYPTYFRMYAFRILRDGELIHNFIPRKRLSDGMAGFYDTVTSVFYENVGENPFIYREKPAELPNKEYYTKEQIVPLEQFSEDDFVTKTKDFFLKQGTNDKGESLLFPLLSTTENARVFAISLEEEHTYEIKIKNHHPDSTTWRMRVALWNKEYNDIKFVPANQDDVQNIPESVGTPADEILISDYQKSNEFVTTFKNDNGYKTLIGFLGWGIDYSYLEVSVRDLDAEKLNEDIKISMDNISDETRRDILRPWSKFTKKPINEQDKINLTNILVSNMGRCNKATQRIMELAYDFWKHRDEFMYSNGTARDNAWNYWSTEGYYDVNTGNTITAENAGWKKIDCSTFVYFVTSGIGYYSSPYYNTLEHTDVVKGALINGEEMNSPDATICRTGKMWIRAGRPLKLESADSSKYYFTSIFGYAEDDTLVQTFDTVSIGTTITPNADVRYIRAEMKVSSASDYAPAVTTIPKAPATILKRLRIREDEQLPVRGACPSDQRYAKHMCQWYDENGYAPNYNRWNYGDNEFPVGSIMWWGRNTATGNYKGITHITLYIGSGYIIHSSTGNMGLKGGQGIHIQPLEELFGSYNEPLSGVAIPDYITDYSEEKELLGIE